MKTAAAVLKETSLDKQTWPNLLDSIGQVASIRESVLFFYEMIRDGSQSIYNLNQAWHNG